MQMSNTEQVSTYGAKIFCAGQKILQIFEKIARRSSPDL